MGRCDLCGKNENLPFRCRYCGGQFCADHRLPPGHGCVHEDQWWYSDQPGHHEQDGYPQARPVRECAYCGEKTSRVFFCPPCGNEYCEVHRLPADHRCGAMHGRAPASPPEAPEKRGRRVRMAWILLLIIAIAVTGFIGAHWISHVSQPQGLSGSLNASSAGQPAPAPALSRTPAETTVAVTAVPAGIRVPPVIRITPASVPPAGVVSYPHIVEDTARGTITKNYTFKFQNRTVAVSASVNKSVYNGAKNSEKTLITSRNDINKSEWAPFYFRAFVNDYHQEKFYTDLVSSLRNVRQEMGLSDDEYLELMAVFVQSLAYDTEGAKNLDSGNRFPVETFVDGKGVCGDKSFLLAGLLSREGYDVALLLFEPEKHMALGVRSSRDDYRNTSYAFLETTRLSFTGVVPDQLAGGIVLKSRPQVIPVGNGWKGYSATPQTVFIWAQRQEAQARVEKLEKEIGPPESDPYRYNALVDEHNRYVTLYNYISTHEYDRPGTYEYALTHAIAPAGAQGLSPQTYEAPNLSAPAYATCNPAVNLSCPAGSRCCESDHYCYAWCQQGVWDANACVCRV